MELLGGARVQLLVNFMKNRLILIMEIQLLRANKIQRV